MGIKATSQMFVDEPWLYDSKPKLLRSLTNLNKSCRLRGGRGVPWGKDHVGDIFCKKQGSDDSYVPACALFCCDEGSATLATLKQSSFSLERGHSSPPAASNRLSLENSAEGRKTETRCNGSSNWVEKDEDVLVISTSLINNCTWSVQLVIFEQSCYQLMLIIIHLFPLSYC